MWLESLMNFSQLPHVGWKKHLACFHQLLESGAGYLLGGSIPCADRRPQALRICLLPQTKKGTKAKKGGECLVCNNKGRAWKIGFTKVHKV